MAEVTVESVKLYVSELVSYWSKYCYLLDVIMEIILWRGVCNIKLFGKDFSIWFPINSLVFFLAIYFALDRPELIPSMVLYAIAYAFLMNNYHLSSHPSPWVRVRSFRQILSRGRTIPLLNSSPRVQIAPEIGVEEETMRELLDEYKIHRVTGFIYEFLMTGLKIYRVYNKNIPFDISTVAKRGSPFSKFYVNYLSYAHTLLRCKFIAM